MENINALVYYFCIFKFLALVLVHSHTLNKLMESITFVETLGSWINWTGQKSKTALEKLKEGTSLPWWATIATATIGVRLIIFPLRLRAWRNGKMMKVAVEYCNKEYASKLREFHRINTHADKRNELFKADMLKCHGDTLKSLKLSPWKSLTPIPVSIPMFLSVASGLRLIDFGGEGYGWIWKDFGVIDPVSAVPVFFGNLFYIEYTRKRQRHKTQTTTAALTMRQRLPFILGHSLNVCSFILLSQVPSGVNLFLFTSSIFSLLESKYLNFKDENEENFLKEFERAISGIKTDEKNKM